MHLSTTIRFHMNSIIHLEDLEHTFSISFRSHNLFIGRFIMEIKHSNEYQLEVAYRAELWKKVYSDVKLTDEEKIWMETHKEFSSLLGAPFLKMDIIQLEKGVKYQVEVTFLDAAHSDQIYKIYPWFKVPCLKGEIRTDYELTDLRGRKSIGKPVKMLITEIDAKKRSSVFSYASSYGTLAVGFYCEYYDQRLRLHTGGLSNGPVGSLYMLREDVDPNRVLYRCKAANSETYDSLIFMVEWHENPGRLQSC